MPTLLESNLLPKTRALVFAPPGRTKTMSSVTMSAQCPDYWTHWRLATPPPPDTPITHLSDALWITFDTQATYGFGQMRVTVPIFDLSSTPLPRLRAESDEVLKLTIDRVKRGLTSTVVIDTISSFDYKLGVMHRNNGLDKFDLYREVLNSHLNFGEGFKGLDCNVLYLCHAKTAGDTVADSNNPTVLKAAANAAKKQTASGTGGIIPAITGAALNYYRGDASFIFAITNERRTDPATQKPREGFFFQTQHNEFDTKSRLILPRELPADWREITKLIGGASV